jgi:hypothetical protein
MSPDKANNKSIPPKSENDIGSPGMLGAASWSDVVHQVEEPAPGTPKPSAPSSAAKRVPPPESVRLMPPDIGGG